MAFDEEANHRVEANDMENEKQLSKSISSDNYGLR